MGGGKTADEQKFRVNIVGRLASVVRKVTGKLIMPAIGTTSLTQGLFLDMWGKSEFA